MAPVALLIAEVAALVGLILWWGWSAYTQDISFSKVFLHSVTAQWTFIALFCWGWMAHLALPWETQTPGRPTEIVMGAVAGTILALWFAFDWWCFRFGVPTGFAWLRAPVTVMFVGVTIGVSLWPQGLPR